MPEFTVRDAALPDLDALVAIEMEAFGGDRLSRRSLRRFLTATHDCCLVAVDGDGRLAGYALYLLRGNSPIARLYSLAVRPDYRGHHIAGKLLKAGAARMVAAGKTRLRLEVREDNAVARALYDQLGFSPIGRLAGYYEDGAAAYRLEAPIADETMTHA